MPSSKSARDGSPRGAFVDAAVGRTGLGNMLFPWARAEVFSQRLGIPMLAPQWTQPKVGPLLRREKDLRYYTGLFDDRSYVRGARRWLAWVGRKRVDGASIGIDAAPDQIRGSLNRTLIVFRGWRGWFRDDLPRHREWVRQRLESIVTDAVRAEIRSFDRPVEIAIHVRRGDMGRNLVPPGAEMGGPDENVVQSEYYFLSVLRKIRQDVGRAVPATVFTDAHEGELKELPTEEKVTIAPPHTAVADLLLMSRAAVLVTSSASSFSAWASYLGGMPTIWQRTRVGLVLSDRPERSIESDPHGNLDGSSREVVVQHLSASTSGAQV